MRIVRLVPILALMTASGLSACAKPQMEDLHIPGGLTGFLFDANATKARNVFPEREQLRQYGWMTFGEDVNSLMVTKYAGAATAEEIEAARDAQAARYGRDTMRYGDVEAITVDGRLGWGWLETQIYKGELASLEYKAVIPFDDVTYAVEFHAGKPDYQDEAKLKAVIRQFQLGRTEFPAAQVAASGLILVFGAIVFFGLGKRHE